MLFLGNDPGQTQPGPKAGFLLLQGRCLGALSVIRTPASLKTKMLHKCLPLSPQTQAWDFRHPVVLMSALPSSCQCNEMFTPNSDNWKTVQQCLQWFQSHPDCDVLLGEADQGNSEAGQLLIWLVTPNTSKQSHLPGFLRDCSSF